MDSIHEIRLTGCTPEPLMGYLKALGVLRLVTEQKDPLAKGCWRGDSFFLRSKLDNQMLAAFVADEYQPSPIFAPWNGDGGFLTDSGASLETIKSLRKSSHASLQSLKIMIENIDQVKIIREFKIARETEKSLNKKKQQQKKAFSKSDAEALRVAKQMVKEIKQNILSNVRSHFPDEVVRWLDACLSISSDGFAASPLLGSGGCDGRLEFSANFLGNVLEYFALPSEDRRHWAERAIFSQGEARLVPTSIGQFSPGQIGGPNATQGFEGESLINPLDFILMVEGAILFAGSVSRKLRNGGTSKAAFPFTVFSSSVGQSMGSAKDSKAARGEIWLPLWQRFAGLTEITHILAEGRAEVNGRQASSGVQLARAVTSLGVDRGIHGFVRYGFLQRNGKAYLATSLGCFDVHSNPDVELLKEMDAWHDRFRGAASGDNVPPRFSSALKHIESAIFNFCKYGGNSRFAEILCALGKAEKELANGKKYREDKYLRPLSALSPEWLRAADDNSPEFELALSLAGIYDPEKKIEPIRANIEPVSYGRWKEKGFCNVWSNAGLSVNLLSVLERRMMDAGRLGCEGLPLASSHKASIEAVSKYIAGDVDDDKIKELLLGMILIDHWKPLKKEASFSFEGETQVEDKEHAFMPRPYAILKLIFLPGGIKTHDEEVLVRPEPAITALLRAGRLGEACSIAARRLRGSGMTPMTYRKGGKPFLDALDWQTEGIDPIRLGAALLFPVSLHGLNELKRMVLRPEKNNGAA